MTTSIRITFRAEHLLAGDHTNYVRFCKWLQPSLQILLDILLKAKAQLCRGGITDTRTAISGTVIGSMHTL